MAPISSLLEKIVQTSQGSSQDLRITSLVQLLACSRILPAKPARESAWNRQERFHLNLLGELYREVRFYYGQFKRNSPVGESRLINALNSLATVCAPINDTVLEYFLDDLAEEDEGGWFLIATFADYPAVISDLFEKRLQNRLIQCARLPEGAKTALQVCKAGNLREAVKPIIAKTTVAVKQDLQDVLSFRNEPIAI